MCFPAGGGSTDFPGKPRNILRRESNPPRWGDDRDVSAGSPPVKLGPPCIFHSAAISPAGGGGSPVQEVGVFRGFRPAGGGLVPVRLGAR